MADKTENSLRRGCRDTWNAYGGSAFQVCALIAAALGGILVAVLIPDSTTGRDQTLYGVAGALGSAVGVGLLFLVWNVYRAPYRQRDESHRHGIQVQTELQRLRDSIAYALEVEGIGSNWPPDVQGGLGITLPLHNRLGKAIRFQVKSLGILMDNNDAKIMSLTNNGGVIYERQMFVIGSLFSNMNRRTLHRGQVNCTIVYGLPEDRATRHLDISANITVDDQTNTVVWIRREEQPTDVPFTDDQPDWQLIHGRASSQLGATS